MILSKINTDGIILFLLISLVIITLVILYKLLLRYLSKGRVKNEDFCTLYSLEESKPTGITEFYFVVKNERPILIKFQILDSKWNLIETLKEQEYSKGGHIIRYNMDDLSAGTYYYGIKTESQETFKKFNID